MDMIPKFKYAGRYYFNVEENTIYGREENSFLYFHEISHFKDHLNPKYRKVSSWFSAYNGFMPYVFAYVSIYATTQGTVYGWMKTYGSFLLIYGIYAAFILQEEIRAYIYAYKRLKLWKLMQKRSPN